MEKLAEDFGPEDNDNYAFAVGVAAFEAAFESGFSKALYMNLEEQEIERHRRFKEAMNKVRNKNNEKS